MCFGSLGLDLDRGWLWDSCPISCFPCYGSSSQLLSKRIMVWNRHCSNVRKREHVFFVFLVLLLLLLLFLLLLLLLFSFLTIILLVSADFLCNKATDLRPPCDEVVHHHHVAGSLRCRSWGSVHQLMAKIRRKNHLGCRKTAVNNGISTTNLKCWSQDFWTINSIIRR